jgi:hypothetical protein
MSAYFKSWSTLALVLLLTLAAGYNLPRPARRGGDLLDAVVAVQRHSPRFLVSEPTPPANWVKTGALYLCRRPRTAEEMDALSKYPGRPDSRWLGVVCFKGTSDPHQLDVPWVSEGGNRCLHYGTFVVFGDAEMLEEVRIILTGEGFQLTRHLWH